MLVFRPELEICKNENPRKTKKIVTAMLLYFLKRAEYNIYSFFGKCNMYGIFKPVFCVFLFAA